MATTPREIHGAQAADYRYARAKRKNNPPAGLAAEGRIAERKAETYAYNHHLTLNLRGQLVDRAISGCVRKIWLIRYMWTWLSEVEILPSTRPLYVDNQAFGGLKEMWGGGGPTAWLRSPPHARRFILRHLSIPRQTVRQVRVLQVARGSRYADGASKIVNVILTAIKDRNCQIAIEDVDRCNAYAACL